MPKSNDVRVRLRKLKKLLRLRYAIKTGNVELVHELCIQQKIDLTKQYIQTCQICLENKSILKPQLEKFFADYKSDEIRDKICDERTNRKNNPFLYASTDESEYNNSPTYHIGSISDQSTCNDCLHTTHLLYAVECGQHEVIKYLVEHGSEIN